MSLMNDNSDDNLRHEKSSASVLLSQIRKPPDVTETNGIAEIKVIHCHKLMSNQEVHSHPIVAKRKVILLSQLSRSSPGPSSATILSCGISTTGGRET